MKIYIEVYADDSDEPTTSGAYYSFESAQEGLGKLERYVGKLEARAEAAYEASKEEEI